MGEPAVAIHHDRQAGTALVLVPTALLIFVVLGSMAVDSTLALMTQRNLVTIAEAAAADGAAVGVDTDALRRTGSLSYDHQRAAEAVERAVHAEAPDATLEWRLHDGEIEVVLHQQVPLLFAPGVKRADRQLEVRARATARLVVVEPSSGGT